MCALVLLGIVGLSTSVTQNIRLLLLCYHFERIRNILWRETWNLEAGTKLDSIVEKRIERFL